MLIRLSEHMKVVKALTTPHQGTVVDNDDPKKLGRVKCTIPSIMEGSPDTLPWIMSQLDPNKFDVPEIGARLKIEFPYDDVYLAFVTGYWHSETNHNSEFDDDYPNAFGLIKQGFKMLYRKVAKTGFIEHPSGSKIEVDDGGGLTLTLVKDFIKNITGNYSITASDNVQIKGSGGVNVESDGQATFKGTGGTTVGSGSSLTKVDGSSVLLAGGGAPVALLGGQTIGIGNLGSPVTSYIIEGSSKVLAAN